MNEFDRAAEKYLAFKTKHKIYPNSFPPGRIIEVEDLHDIQFFKYEPYSDHKSALDTLKGI